MATRVYMDELDAETEMSRIEAATFLRDFADKLESGASTTGAVSHQPGDPVDAAGPETPPGEDVTTEDAEERATTTGSSSQSAGPETMTVIVGGQSATLVLPDRLDLDVEVGSRSGLLESGIEQHVAFDLSWVVEELPEDDRIEVT